MISHQNPLVFGLADGSDSNVITLAGDITSTGATAHGILINLNSDSNIINMTGNITTKGANAQGIQIDASDNNNLTIDGNIITSGTGGNSEAILIK